MHYSHVWGNFLLVSFSDFLVAPSTNCEGNEKERKMKERKKERKIMIMDVNGGVGFHEW